MEKKATPNLKKSEDKASGGLTRRQKRNLMHPKTHAVEVHLTNGDKINITMSSACVQKEFIQLGSDFTTNPVFNKNIKRANVRSERAERFAAKYR